MHNAKRIIYIDLLKVIALFAVLVIHTTPKGLWVFPVWSFDYSFTLFFSSLARFAVPVFIMCSGALFLDLEKEYPAKKMFTKYIPRILCSLIFFIIFYELFSAYHSHFTMNVPLSDALNTAYDNMLRLKTHYHLYYLFIIILIYALVPVIKTYLKTASRRNVFYVICFMFLFAIAFPFSRNFYPMNKYFAGMLMQYQINLSYGMILYFLAGHYINTYEISKPKRIVLILLGAVGVATTFFGTALMSIKTGLLYEAFLSANTPNVFFTAIAVFVIVKQIKINNTCVKKAIVFLSKASFCVFLIHDVFIKLFEDIKFDILAFKPYLSLPLLITALLVPSVIIYVVVRKIPLLKYLIS